jgi:hypothetical protein
MSPEADPSTSPVGFAQDDEALNLFFVSKSVILSEVEGSAPGEGRIRDGGTFLRDEEEILFIVMGEAWPC